MRPSGRAPDQLRTVSLEPGFSRHAEGSCLIKFGDTHVLCTASVDEKVPPFLRNSGRGWVTAEYGMLPRSTHTRTDREAARGKQSGRTQEIQRLIGRSLRAVVDLPAMGERQINIDCDVLQADGGTRTASITGSWVALHLAFERLIKDGKMTANPLTGQVAAVSCDTSTPIPCRRRSQVTAGRACDVSAFEGLCLSSIGISQMPMETCRVPSCRRFLLTPSSYGRSRRSSCDMILDNTILALRRGCGRFRIDASESKIGVAEIMATTPGQLILKQ